MSTAAERPPRYQPSRDTFTTAAGVFPAVEITPAMVRALHTSVGRDDRRIKGSTQTMNRLVRYGLAEQHGHVYSVRITEAGINALALFPSPPGEEPPEDVEAVLARARRWGLIYAWETTLGVARPYKVLVGRGSIGRGGALTDPEVRALFDRLRRDNVTVRSNSPYDVGSRIQRYDLSDGRFLDRNHRRGDRHFDEHPYTVFLPGGAVSGSAEIWLSARTKREALALAGLSRVCGQCTNCKSMRPLNVRDWTPDIGVHCPGCGAGLAAAVVLLCRNCTQPIEPYEDPLPSPWSSAWVHTGKTVYCENVAPKRGDDAVRAQPGGSA